MSEPKKDENQTIKVDFDGHFCCEDCTDLVSLSINECPICKKEIDMSDLIYHNFKKESNHDFSCENCQSKFRITKELHLSNYHEEIILLENHLVRNYETGVKNDNN